jgi:hypothetical protein
MLLYSPEARALPVSLAAAGRPQKLDGLRIGFLDNTKAPVDKIMAYLSACLSERIPGITTFQISKQHPSLPAEPEVLQALAANADVVVNALGD